MNLGMCLVQDLVCYQRVVIHQDKIVLCLIVQRIILIGSQRLPLLMMKVLHRVLRLEIKRIKLVTLLLFSLRVA